MVQENRFMVNLAAVSESKLMAVDLRTDIHFDPFFWQCEQWNRTQYKTIPLCTQSYTQNHSLRHPAYWFCHKLYFKLCGKKINQ